jgi:type 1 glutamine amidotransferase
MNLKEAKMKYLFPVLLCAALLCGNASAADAPLKVCMLSASNEYKSDESLAAYKKYLEENFNVSCSIAVGKEKGTELTGLEALDTSDVLFVFTRRLTLPDDQIQKIKKHCESGKPVIGVRTASHAFQNWLEFDKDVLGGNYKNHFGAGPITQVEIVEAAKDHPILAGVKPFTSPSSLYRNTGQPETAKLLMTGQIPGNKEPLTWTHEYKGGRVFYTSLGGTDDFKNDNFIKMLTNALAWVSKRELSAKK